MSQWKQIHSKPAGALPGNLMTRIGVGAIALLGGVLMLTHSFTNTNRDPAASPDASAQPANQGVQRHLSALIDRETARQEQRLAAEAVDKLQRQTAASATSDELKQAAMPPVFRVASETPVTSDPGTTEDELKLQETLRLEDIERRTRSLRSLPLAQSYRPARVAEDKFSNQALGSAAIQQAEVAKAPSPEESGLRDVVAELSASLNSFGANPNGPPGALPRPALPDPSAAAPTRSFTDPTRPSKLVQLSDPQAESLGTSAVKLRYR